MPELNARVLAYCEAHLGQKVGNGECWTLANEALKAAGAFRANGYTYGRRLKDGELVYPGDIIQMEGCHFGTGSRSYLVQHHTVLVRKVIAAGRYEVLQQNPRPVSSGIYDFNQLTQGVFSIWRPQN